ncbi:hypothetical protein MKW98_031039 [Papaver atlanticum]|uniref:Uncharacterized protein n=1 Tax=Papaver atlanticum TaxID=357466 RepID=A0AAD4XLY2_9MAGN|nr:hypothetical protein MKW98_031039 [Papaver atlanticum]
MEKYAIITIIITLFFFNRYAVANEAVSITKLYIVYMGEHSYPDSNWVISSNHELLAPVAGSFGQAKEAITYHYHKSFRGFLAKLTTDKAQKLRETESVISVFESKTNQLHTTHSWDFLGVDNVPQNNANVGSKSDVIVGVIDTGVLPESESFNDNGLGPVPKRFKGVCVAGDQFTVNNCNRKIIGARIYSKGYEAVHGPLESFNATFFRSPRDSDGHGTHTASTVSGSVVNNVSLFGMASGTARGGMPNARLAIYKRVAAFDDAISDGVDIISISIGSSPEGFFDDPISIGSFHAFKKGILVSTSAGNSGFATTKCAPWLLTVAASSIDREFNSNVQLGNSKILKVRDNAKFQGSSLNPLKMDKFHRVIFARDASAAGVTAGEASLCFNGTLDHKLIKWKIVVCSGFGIDNPDVVVREGGGVGMILIPLFGLNEYSSQYVIPTTALGTNELQALQNYVTRSKNPTAKISPTKTILKATRAPKMAFFSSIGPNTITPDIIKPDITAPDVRILAAWSPVNIELTAGRSVDYNIISGTSMACPHASGIAAMIKSHHPSWSPSAIKSAIMTTANAMDNAKRAILEDSSDSPASPFNYGSGHVNPIAALDPGLVYDFGSNDLIEFLCSTRAYATQIQMLTGTKITCKSPPVPMYDLNYPSIGVANMNGSVTVVRTLDSPAGVKVKATVKPKQLKFKEAGENMKFGVTFVADKTSHGSLVFGSLTWSSGNKYKVRIPIGLNLASAIQVRGK